MKLAGPGRDAGSPGVERALSALRRPPIESPEPVLRFAALRLLLAIAALVALVATGTPFNGGLTAVVAALALPWALANLFLAQSRPDLALSPLIPAGDLAVLAAAELVTPETYGVVRFLAIFLIAAHAQFQGQVRGLVIAFANCAVLVPIAVARGAPVNGDILTFYETLFVVCAFATALTSSSIRTAETTGRLRAREVSRHMIETESEIRRRVAESIHDGPVQELVSLDMILSALGAATERGDSEAAKKMLDEAHIITERNVQTLRDEIVALGPYAFRELSFETAIVDCVPVWQRRYGLDVRLDFEPIELVPEINGPLFLIAQEAVTNAGRHADCSRVTVSLRTTPGRVELRVADDGKGFGDLWPLAQESAGHIGLSSMRERAEMLNGSLTIDSGGRGTVVTVRLPLDGVGQRGT
ncbi:MAG TPA: sensor histidine kinase [Thermoleophilaceae bacterium]